MFLGGGLPVRLSDIAVGPLFGIVYYSFAWSMASRWRPKDGPQFLYHFMDTTLPVASSVAIVVLLLVLTVAYVAFAEFYQLVEFVGEGFLAHISCVVAVLFLVCRFR